MSCIGKQFGRLTVISERTVGRLSTVRCRCQCGTEKTFRYWNLITGNSTSCGCKTKEANSKRLMTHGKYGTRIWRLWSDIKKRCYDPNFKFYKDYGGRGITMCAKWRESLDAFHLDVGDPPDGLTID